MFKSGCERYYTHNKSTISPTIFKAITISKESLDFDVIGKSSLDTIRSKGCSSILASLVYFLTCK